MTSVLGTFSPEVVEKMVWEYKHTNISLRGISHAAGKVLDIALPGRHIQGFATRTGDIQLVSIV